MSSGFGGKVSKSLMVEQGRVQSSTELPARVESCFIGGPCAARSGNEENGSGEMEAEELLKVDSGELKVSLSKPCTVACFMEQSPKKDDRKGTGKKKESFTRNSCKKLMEIVEKYGLVKPVVEKDSAKDLRCVAKNDFSNLSILVDLDKFVERELRLRCDTKSQPRPVHLEDFQLRSDVKLRIFQEAFLILIRNFPTIRRILVRIKDAYDEALTFRDRRLSEFAKMRSTMNMMEMSIEKEKAAIWMDGREKISELLREKVDLLRIIDTMSMEKWKQKKMIEELDEELTRNQRKLLDEIDARRLILFEFNQLNEQMNVLRNKAKATGKSPEQAVEETVNEDVETTGDAIVLRVALNKSRRALGEMQAKVNYMETVYKDVCPLRVYDELQKSFKELKSEHSKMIQQASANEKNIRRLEELSETLRTERDLLKLKIKEVEDRGTPRWDWKKCAQFVKGGISEWEKLTFGKNSRDRFEIFLQQLQSTPDFGPSYFKGRGLDPAVPAFLRYEGQVQNRRYWLRDVRMFISDIWRNKSLEENNESLVVYLDSYLRQRYHTPQLQAEFAYNLVEGCRRCSYDDQVRLFQGILSGEVPEESYHVLANEMAQLREAVNAKMKALKTKKLLSSAAFCDAIRGSFPFKTEMDIVALLEAAMRQLGIQMGEDLNIWELFEENEEGLEQKDLGRTLCEQYRLEQNKYAGELLQSVMTLLQESELNKPDDPLISFQIIKQAFLLIDPAIEDHVLDHNLRWIFSASNTDGVKPIPLSALTDRLAAGNIRRVKAKKTA